MQTNYRYRGIEFPVVCSLDCLHRYLFDASEAGAVDYPVVKCPALTHDHHYASPVTGLAYRSNFEMVLAEWLLFRGWSHEYEKIGFCFGDVTYTPDFHVRKAGVLIEAKGTWWFGQRSKFRTFLNQYPGVNIIIAPWELNAELENGFEQRREVLYGRQ